MSIVAWNEDSLRFIPHVLVKVTIAVTKRQVTWEREDLFGSHSKSLIVIEGSQAEESSSAETWS